MIGAVAQALQTYHQRVPGCRIGRLNGSDFALCLPVGGMALETAQAVSQALGAVLPAFGPGIGVALGAVEMQHEREVAQVMAAADTALARAESQGPFSVELAAEAGPSASRRAAALGETAWRQRIAQALGGEGARLVAFPVVDAANQLIHFECPLRMQLEDDGPFEPAVRWLPLALRGRLTAEVDARALELALADAARDGQPRCVNIAPASLADSAFAPRLRALLWAAPQAAKLLSLEVAEAAAVDHFPLLQELSRQLRPTGVRLGLEHAGERLGRIPRLFEAGLHYVKLDAAVVRGAGADDQRATFVRGTVTLLHGLSLQVYAEGVVDEGDAKRLWECGVDGQTGPYVSARQGG
jgi:EAL domain-containing protein (putative c-di-GMP-specific phosphodiesterase class I)